MFAKLTKLLSECTLFFSANRALLDNANLLRDRLLLLDLSIRKIQELRKAWKATSNLCQFEPGPSSQSWKLQAMEGCGALHWAAYKGDEPSLQLLEYFSADFHAVDNEQMTLLHRAAQGHQERIISFLLERGVDPSAVDNQGRTCLEVAQQVSAKSPTARRLARLLEPKRSSDVEAGTRRLVLRPGAEEMERVIHSAKMWVPALFWLCCVSIACLEFLLDLSTSAATLLPSTAMAFQAGVPLCLLVFATIAFSDPGKAPVRVKGNSAVEDLQLDACFCAIPAFKADQQM
eukprot:s3517_g2.t1